MRVHTLRVVTMAALSAGVSPGCVYISQQAREAREEEVDQDGDGAYYAGPNKDCDDLNPDRAPGMPEIPYDGIDNDCKNDGDIVDVDGDLIPGVLYEDWIKIAAPGLEWPQSVLKEILVNGAAVPALDCVDQDVLTPDGSAVRFVAANIRPGDNNPNEAAYDGIDADCKHDNDFDNDGDGFMPDTIVFGGTTIDVADAYATYIAEWGYEADAAAWFPSGSPAYGDCEDSNAAVNPGAGQVDTPYDGIDTNCDGVNDFDPDGDGFMPPTHVDATGATVPTAPAFTAFINRYGLTIPLPDPVVVDAAGTTVDAFSDCLDLGDARAGLSAYDPATIYPRAYSLDPFPAGAADVPYDGIDTDCLGDDDFDADRDSFPTVPGVANPNDKQVTYQSYFSAWGYAPKTWETTREDCDDRNPDTNPEKLETLGGDDQNCGPDLFRFSGRAPYVNLEWTYPRNLSIARFSDSYIVTVANNSLFQSDVNGIQPPQLTGPAPVALHFKLANATGQAELAAQPIGVAFGGNGSHGLNRVDVRDGCNTVTGEPVIAWHFANSSVRPWVGYYYVQAGAPSFTYIADRVHGSFTEIERLNSFVHAEYIADCTVRTVATDVDSFEYGTSTTNGITTGVTALVPPGGFVYGEPELEVADEDWIVAQCVAGVDCVRHYLGPQPTSETITGEQWTRGVTHYQRNGDWTTVLEDDVQNMVQLRSNLLASPVDVEPPSPYGVLLDADGYVFGDFWYVLMLEDVGDIAPNMWLMYAPIDDPTAMELFPLTFDVDNNPDTPPEAIATEVALHVDEDRILIAGTALDPLSVAYDEINGNPLGDGIRLDKVGWLFLGPPEAR